MGVLRTSLFVCLIIVLALCVLSEAKGKSKQGKSNKTVKKPSKGKVVTNNKSQQRSLASPASKLSEVLPVVKTPPKQTKETQKKSKAKDRSKEKKSKASTEKKEKKNKSKEKKLSKEIKKHIGVKRHSKESKEMKAHSKESKEAKKHSKEKDHSQESKEAKKQSKEKHRSKESKEAKKHSKENDRSKESKEDKKHSKEKDRSTESKEDKKHSKDKDRSKESKEDKKYSKEKDRSKESKEDKNYSKEKDRSKESKEDKKYSKEKHRSKERKEDKKYSKEKDRSKESKEDKKHSKEKDRSKESKEDKKYSKEKDRSKESKEDKKHSKEKDRSKESKEDKKYSKEKDRSKESKEDKKHPKEKDRSKESKEDKKHSKEKDRSKESKEDKKHTKEKDRSKESKEDKKHSKEKDRSKESKEDKTHSKDKDRSKESKEDKNYSKEKDRSKESKEDKNYSKEKDRSKESKEDKKYSKEKDRSKESKEDKNYSKEKDRSKESKEDKKHSKEKDRSKESKEDKKHSKEKDRSKENKSHSPFETHPQKEIPLKGILCENQRKIIQCGAGEVIEIISASYGRKSRTICPHNSIRTLNCDAKSSMPKVKEWCNEKQTCILIASNSVFGDPCGGTYKYLDVKYTCRKVKETNGNAAVICENNRKTIQCDAGEVIEITSASYGRKSRTICPHKSIRTLNCDAKSSMPKVKEWCNEKQTCVLIASNSKFGDPCGGTYKYLDVKYTCRKAKETNGNAAVICENNRKTIQCDAGEVIEITSASYGRKSRTICPHRSIRTLNCDAKSSMPKVKEWCNEKQTCVLIASNSKFGDPCGGTYKYLDVKYTCRKVKETKTASPNLNSELLCEHKTKSIRCDGGRTIKITKASYGRTTKSICPHNSIRTTKCDAKSAMSKVREACDGRDTCVLSASNSVFGDPCRGTFKYLEVQYACVNTGVRYITIDTPKQRTRYSYINVNKHGYTLDGRKTFEFEVKACNDAHVALMGPNGEKDKLYEIVIGGWANSQSVIRTRKQGPNIYTNRGRYLDCHQYRRFKVTWYNGEIKVLRHANNVWATFMAWKDSKPLDVRSIGVSGGLWADVYWKIMVKDDNTCNGRKCHANAKCFQDGCVCNRGFYGDGYNSCEKSCLCMASGDPHYRTFDRQMIHFMGTCKYTLTRSIDRNGTCSFNVEVKNERRGRNTRVSFTRFVDVEIYGRRIRLHQSKKVYIDNERRYLPVIDMKGQLKVTLSGRYVQIWTACGVLVNFDGVHAVSVVVPASFSSKMTGLCGDCDGKMNDFRTKDGRDVTSHPSRYNLVGNSYKVHEIDSDPRCVPVVQDTPQCDPSLANRLNKREYCGEILEKNGQFAKCISKFPVQAKGFFDSCVFDLCSFQGESHKMNVVKCNALEAFAEECEENGILAKWRSPKLCPLKSEDPNAVYKVNASGCPSTCVDPLAPSKCTLEPREGFECKDGFILSDGKCIHQSQCGCVDNEGAYFPLNARKITRDCRNEFVCRMVGPVSRLMPIAAGRRCDRNAECKVDTDGHRKCVCKQGYDGDGVKTCQPLCGQKYKCNPQATCRDGKCRCNRGLTGDGIRNCEEMCTCSASGDPHYRTYDGQMIHFMGICKYLLTKTTKADDPCKFSVLVANERRGRNRRVSYTKRVTVQVYGIKITMKKDGHVFVDGKQKYLPIREMNGNLTMFISGRYVRLWTACGHRVSWDGRSVVRVSVSKTYAGSLTGLCGDCDGKQNDFRTKNGQDVSKNRNRYAIIGRSYNKGGQVSGDKESCITTEDDVQCSKSIMESASNKDKCGFMDPKMGKLSPFGACTSENNAMATDLFNACKFDVCSYFDDPQTRQDAICRSMEALEAECETRGFNIKWRRPDFCPITCPANMRYSAAVSGCPATCLMPNSEHTCELEDTEGCECLPGFLLSGTECVPEEKCGCLTPKGDYLPLGSTFVSEDCTTVTKCTHENGEAILERIIVNQRCHKNGMCGVVEGRPQCTCKDGYHGDGIKSCLPLCGGRYKCHEDATCNNGECVCNGGKYGDGINTCFDACVCSASGDPHYYTFDGQTIHFMGICKYSMSKLAINDTCQFDVQVKNEHRNNLKHVSFTRLVDITLGDESIRLLQNRKLQLNDVLTYTPYKDPKGRFVVVMKGRHIILLTKCGLVTFDGHHAVSVIVPRDVGDHLTGICGNCDGKKNDFKTKNGKDVSKKADKFQLIGSSYEVIDTSEGAEKECKTDDVESSCSKAWVRRIKSDEFCGKLIDKKGLFGQCIKRQPKFAASFYHSCLIDLCAAEGDDVLAMKLLCQSLEGFADNCQANGDINKPWRNMNLCPLQCSPSEVYSPGIVGNPRTCNDLDEEVSYPLAPAEGCVCKEGFVRSGVTCVRERDCGCFYNRQYYPLNGTGPLTDCDRVQTCIQEDGINRMVLEKRQLECRRNAECRKVDGIYKCLCKEGFTGNNNVGCKEDKVGKTTAPESTQAPTKNPTQKPTPKPTEKPTPKPTPKSTEKTIPTNEPTTPKAVSLPSPPPVTNKPAPPTQTPKPKPKPNRPIYVPISKCQIEAKHQSCGSSLSLTGACSYKSQFSNQCKFSVQILKLGTKLFAKVHVNRRVRILRDGRGFSDCASFKMSKSTVVITDNICEKCTLELIRNLTPRGVCKG